jgi:hypothetical protein
MNLRPVAGILLRQFYLMRGSPVLTSIATSNRPSCALYG